MKHFIEEKKLINTSHPVNCCNTSITKAKQIKQPISKFVNIRLWFVSEEGTFSYCYDKLNMGNNSKTVNFSFSGLSRSNKNLPMDHNPSTQPQKVPRGWKRIRETGCWWPTRSGYWSHCWGVQDTNTFCTLCHHAY